MNNKAVLWDLDSTLANTAHRQPMVPEIKEYKEGGPTWEDYSMACTGDTPVASTVALAQLLHGTVHQYGVSGRNVCAKQLTQDWLDKHKVPLERLFLRNDGDHTPNGRYKVGIIKLLRASGIEVVLFVEDWKETAEYITEKTGVPVLLVQGDYAVDGDPL